MVAIPEPISTVDLIFRSYEERERERGDERAHLGASEVGHECDRHLWLIFHWAARKGFDGRMLRLLDTGNNQEDRLIADLERIGATVLRHDRRTGRQWRVAIFGGRFGGSLDGMVRGLVEAPKTLHGLELKSHKASEFTKLVKKGVKEAKPEHWWQMQSYMGMSHEPENDHLPEKLDRFLYLAVNKDTDELYMERVYFDAQAYAVLKARVERIINLATPPARIGKMDYFVCKLCDFFDVCHGGKVADMNCRTCLHSTTKPNGTWECEDGRGLVNIGEQRRGCERHLYVPGLLPWKQIDATNDEVIYAGTDGAQIRNARGGAILR